MDEMMFVMVCLLDAIDVDPNLRFLAGLADADDVTLEPHTPFDQGCGAMVVGFLALNDGRIAVDLQVGHGSSLQVDAECGEGFG